MEERVFCRGRSKSRLPGDLRRAIGSRQSQIVGRQVHQNAAVPAMAVPVWPGLSGAVNDYAADRRRSDGRLRG